MVLGPVRVCGVAVGAMWSAATVSEHWYYVYFKVQRAAGSSEHTREVSLSEPIEFASDVAIVSKACAQLVGATDAMVIGWYPLRGQLRPESAQGAP